MTIREKLAQLDSEGAVGPPPNPLRTFLLRIAESAIVTYAEYRDQHATPDIEDVDAWARTKAIGEVAGALDTYGIFTAYPGFLAVVKAIAAWFEPGQTIFLSHIAGTAKTALALFEQSLLPDVAEGSGYTTPEDAPL